MAQSDLPTDGTANDDNKAVECWEFKNIDSVKTKTYRSKEEVRSAFQSAELQTFFVCRRFLEGTPKAERPNFGAIPDSLYEELDLDKDSLRARANRAILISLGVATAFFGSLWLGGGWLEDVVETIAEVPSTIRERSGTDWAWFVGQVAAAVTVSTFMFKIHWALGVVTALGALSFILG